MSNELRCLDRGSKKVQCNGPVEMRVTPDRRDGKAFARCEAHFELRLEDSKHIMELTSPTPAPWFDESYAGERWDDEY